jgi:FMN phosphatase YigB (HAD superfamily)
MTERRHDAWLVDLDGTLYRPLPVKLAMAVELLASGWGAIRTLRVFRHEHEALRRELSDEVPDPFALQLERAAATLGVEPSDVQARVRSWMIERPGKWIRLFRRRGLLAEIGAFRAQGGRVALVSDYPARAKLAALRAEPLFDEVVACGEPGGPGRLKPSPDGYAEAARRLLVSPARCLVVGDRDDADGRAARAAGMDFRRVG